MKKILFSFIFIISLASAFQLAAQTGIAINTDGSAADGSAMLDIKATDKGILIPRVALTSSVTSPVNGLLVYQTGGTPGFYYYNGSAWIYIQNSGNANVTLQGNTFNGASQLLQLNASAKVATANLGTGTANSTTFLRGDGTWAPAGGGGNSLQYGSITSGVTNTVTVTDVTKLTVVSDLNGGSGAGTTLNFVLPSAASYTAGTVITWQLTAYTGSTIATFTFTSPGSFLSGFATVIINNVSVNTAFTLTGSQQKFSVVSDGGTHWYKIN